MKKILINTNKILKAKISSDAINVNNALDELYSEFIKFDNVSQITVEELVGCLDSEQLIRRKTAEGLKNKKFEGFPINVNKMMEIIDVEDCSAFKEKLDQLNKVPAIVDSMVKSHDHNFHQIAGDKVVLNSKTLNDYIDGRCNIYLSTSKQKVVYNELLTVKDSLEKILNAGCQITVRAPYVDEQKQGLLSKYLSVDVNNKSVELNESLISQIL